MIPKRERIYIADHEGLVGGAIMKELARLGYRTIVTSTRARLDLRDQRATERFFARAKPAHVVIAAQKSGGIAANIATPGDFLYDNAAIAQNTMTSAVRHGAKSILFFGASCVYPLRARQPIREDSLMTGPLEETSYAYSIAKIMGLALGEAYAKQYGVRFVALVPATAYGPGGNFDPKTAHVISSLIHKFAEAKRRGEREVVVWGTGKPKREFVYIDDLASAVVFLLNSPRASGLYNVGAGGDVSIRELATKIKRIVGFKGMIRFDRSKPDGAMRKLLDSRKIRALGWSPKTPLDIGIKKSYDWYRGRNA